MFRPLASVQGVGAPMQGCRLNRVGRGLFLVRMAFLLVLWAGAQVAARAQSLWDLYGAARLYDSTFQAAQLEYEASHSRVAQARAALLPRLDMDASATRAQQRNRPPGGRFTGTTQGAAITAEQPIFVPTNRLTLEQQQQLEGVAHAQLIAAEQDLIVRLSRAYFDVLAAQDTLTLVRAQKAAVAEQRASAQRNFEVGATTITDTREAQASFDLVRALEIAAENDLHVKKLALDQLTGLQQTHPLPLAEPIHLPALEPMNVQQWIERAESAHPSVHAAQLALEVARLETSKAKAGHLPTVGLSASYSAARRPEGTYSLPGTAAREREGQIGVSMNLPLFAGFAVQNRIRETLTLEEKAHAELDTARRNTAQLVRTLYFNVVSGLSQVQALEAAQASGELALEANVKGYEVGVRINMDVLTAQSQLYETKRNLAQARYNILLGHLQLRQAAGSLNEGDLQGMNALIERAPVPDPAS